MFELGRPCVFGFDVDGLGGIGGDGRVIGDKRRLEAVKGMTVCGEIVSRGIDKTGEVVAASWDVDGLEKVGKKLANLLQVVIGRGTNDGWEFGCCIGDDEFGLLRCCHGADGEGRGK